GTFREIVNTCPATGGSFWKRKSSARLVVPIELIQGPLPSIAFVRYQSLQHCQYCVLALAGRNIFDQAGIRWDSIEACMFCQISPDLKVRIETRFLVAEQLEDKAVTIDNRRVTLFSRSAPNRQWSIGRGQNLVKGRAGSGTNSSMMHLELFALF